VWIAWFPGKLQDTTVFQVIKTFLHSTALENYVPKKKILDFKDVVQSYAVA
jgi:hypothetical protein